MQPLEMSILADRYAIAREARLDLEKEVDKLKETENDIKKLLMDAMRTEEVSSIGGQVALITHRRKPKAVAKQWPLIHQHIMRTGDFGIMHARLADKHLLELQDNGVIVAGMEWFHVDELSVGKAKK